MQEVLIHCDDPESGVHVTEIMTYDWSSSNPIFTAQCTLVHMRGLGIACRPSVRLSVRPSIRL